MHPGKGQMSGWMGQKLPRVHGEWTKLSTAEIRTWELTAGQLLLIWNKNILGKRARIHSMAQQIGNSSENTQELKTYVHTETCTHVFKAAGFTTAKK